MEETLDRGPVLYAAYTPDRGGIGPVSAAISGGAVTDLSLSGGLGDFVRGLKARYGAARPLVADPAAFRPLFLALDRYFSGLPEPFGLRLAPTGTDFQLRLWEALSRVPWGSVVTYGELAAMAGAPGAARAVGAACGANPLPLLIPCHRVVRAGGGIGGYSGGAGVKAALLCIEGHRVGSGALRGGS